ncbi:MAG: hypothetical protein IJW13_02095 [Clostridia bacterium]|nr:hypothetical protein [Clostridia bacterium]
MDKDFYMGVILGMLGGAIAAANSLKVRRAIRDGQEQVMTAINKMSENGISGSPENRE